jgi:hypothetical protein
MFMQKHLHRNQFGELFFFPGGYVHLKSVGCVGLTLLSFCVTFRTRLGALVAMNIKSLSSGPQ